MAAGRGRPPVRRPSAPFLKLCGALGCVVGVVATAAGCASSPATGAREPSRPLPTYVGRPTELFDDTIEPRAVGLELESAGRFSPLLRERTQSGDAVVRVRIDTVTGKNDGVSARYDLGLRVLERLAGQSPPPATFGVRIDGSSPSAPILKSFQARLTGKTFVVFVREFVRPDGDSDYHFHIAADDKDTVAAVKEAGVLGELK